MRFRQLVLLLLALPCITFASNDRLYSHPLRPKMALMITIDGLEPYEIEHLNTRLNNHGIKKILDRAAYDPSAHCSYLAGDHAAFHASISTGCAPSTHGIIAEKYYSRIDDNIQWMLDDARYESINSNVSASPRLLQAATIADAIELYNPKCNTIVIGLSPTSTILTAGHLADYAVWLDDETAKYATTEYYEKGLPLWASNINRSGSIAAYCDTVWKPLRNLNSYNFASQTLFNTEPNPRFARINDMHALKNSPYINTIVRKAAVEAIKECNLGADAYPDLLCVEFAMYHSTLSSPLCAESEDMLERLDEEIELLLHEIDTRIGLDDVIITLAAPHAPRPENKQNSKFSFGTFNTSRAMALTNAYLMAIFGQGRWITGCCNRNIYLNRALIEEKDIILPEMQNLVAQFITEFSGVLSAQASHNLTMQNNTHANAHYKNRSGDVIYELQTGWIDENEKYASTSFYNETPIAIWWKGTTIQADKICVEDIAPTILRMLQIPLPQNAEGKSLYFK